MLNLRRETRGTRRIIHPASKSPPRQLTTARLPRSADEGRSRAPARPFRLAQARMRANDSQALPLTGHAIRRLAGGGESRDSAWYRRRVPGYGFLLRPRCGAGAVAVCGLVALPGCFFVPNGNVGGSGTDGATNSANEHSSTIDSPTGGAAPQILCTDAPYALRTGFVGIDYATNVRVEGGEPPYSWDVDGLPPGLKLEVSDADSAEAVIWGIPQATGDFPVELSVIDAGGTPSTSACGTISVFAPLALDPAALVSAFPDGCISDPAVGIDDLLALGILNGGDGTQPTCSLIPGRGHGMSNFDGDFETPDTIAPGLAVDPETCRLSGTVDPSLHYGVYAWITTVRQTGVDVHLPYCASQTIEPDYEIIRTDAGEDRTLAPGLAFLGASANELTYGSDLPDPQVRVDYGMDCPGSCFYAYIFSYATVSASANVSSSPSAKYPAMGFEGFTHAIRITEPDTALLDGYRARAFVVPITWDYCMAQNDLDCGNNTADPDEKAAIIRENGGGGYRFSLIVLPE
ncbi:hypothetical protein [Nannocystis pusilla]|uniref:Uncharacterized protein n=1 Tax=Nannocystis pusilla TaxID=889268 RepID=A0ABS7TVM8_9BACT|nr:hypothetical protein [Nannocystis pusilla]MBZ5712318.1 hypothetical protein [Nannocystis pusilla]